MYIFVIKTFGMKLLILFFFFFSFFFLSAQEEKPDNVIQKKVETVANYNDLNNAAFGFYAIDLTTGKVIADHNGSMSIVPASTMKLVSTGAALMELGPGFRFKTQIFLTGTLDSITGELWGDIVIKGGGDPTLGSRFYNKRENESSFLMEWVDTLKKMGIKKVRGSVIGDDGIFTYDGVPSGWVWGDMGNYYGSGPSGLTVFDNMHRLSFNTGNSGEPTELECFEPYSEEVKFTNYVKAANIRSDQSYAYGAPFWGERYIQGSLPEQQEGYEVKVSMHDPAYVLAQHLQHELEQAGIAIMYQCSTSRRLGWERNHTDSLNKSLVYEHLSPSLSSIINQVNHSSVNLFAEHLLTYLGYVKYGVGSNYNGCIAVENFWSKKIASKGMYVSDGSGLSRNNAISAYHLVEILKYMGRTKYADTFKSSLAVAGKSGTFYNFCRGTAAQGRVFGKSGTMSRTKSYAGYVDSKSGKKIAFAVISNNYNCYTSTMKKYMEGIVELLASY